MRVQKILIQTLACQISSTQAYHIKSNNCLIFLFFRDTEFVFHMCIHYLLAGVSVTDDLIKNNEARSNDAPSTSEGNEIHQGNGTDSEEKPEDEKDKKKQATLKGRVMMIFFYPYQM